MTDFACQVNVFWIVNVLRAHGAPQSHPRRARGVARACVALGVLGQEGLVLVRRAPVVGG